MDLPTSSQVVSESLVAIEESQLIVESDLAEEFHGKISLQYLEKPRDAIIQDLPKFQHGHPDNPPYQSYQVGRQIIEDTCPICWNNFEIGESLVHGRRCQHLFHTSCLSQWLQNHLNPLDCPLCRNKL